MELPVFVFYGDDAVQGAYFLDLHQPARDESPFT
jgi:hypothetical protein